MDQGEKELVAVGITVMQGNPVDTLEALVLSPSSAFRSVVRRASREAKKKKKGRTSTGCLANLRVGRSMKTLADVM